MGVQITHTVAIQMSHGTSLSELQTFIDAVKESGIENPVLSITHYAGDQREPSLTTITATAGRNR